MRIEWLHKRDVLELGEGLFCAGQRRALVSEGAEKFCLCCAAEFSDRGHWVSNVDLDIKKFRHDIALVVRVTEDQRVINMISEATNEYILSNTN